MKVLSYALVVAAVGATLALVLESRCDERGVRASLRGRGPVTVARPVIDLPAMPAVKSEASLVVAVVEAKKEAPVRDDEAARAEREGRELVAAMDAALAEGPVEVVDEDARLDAMLDRARRLEADDIERSRAIAKLVRGDADREDARVLGLVQTDDVARAAADLVAHGSRDEIRREGLAIAAVRGGDLAERASVQVLLAPQSSDALVRDALDTLPPLATTSSASRVSPFIMKACARGDAATRAAAARRLVEVPASERVLEELANDRDPLVSEQARASLGR